MQLVCNLKKIDVLQMFPWVLFFETALIFIGYRFKRVLRDCENKPCSSFGNSGVLEEATFLEILSGFDPQLWPDS